MPQDYIETVVLDNPLQEARRDLPQLMTSKQPATREVSNEPDTHYDALANHSWLT